MSMRKIHEFDTSRKPDQIPKSVLWFLAEIIKLN